MGFVSLPLQNFSYSAAATTTPTQNLQPNLQTLITHNIILSALEIITPKPKSTNSCTPQRVNNSPPTHISQNLQIHKIILNTWSTKNPILQISTRYENWQVKPTTTTLRKKSSSEEIWSLKNQLGRRWEREGSMDGYRMGKKLTYTKVWTKVQVQKTTNKEKCKQQKSPPRNTRWPSVSEGSLRDYKVPSQNIGNSLTGP